MAERGVLFRTVTGAIATTGPMGRAMLTIIAAFAELERDTIRERTAAGLAVARARGRAVGRPRSLPPAMVEVAQTLRARGRSAIDIASDLGTSPATIYRALTPAKTG